MWAASILMGQNLDRWKDLLSNNNMYVHKLKKENLNSFVSDGNNTPVALDWK